MTSVMATDGAHVGPNDICPDPSVHHAQHHHSRLQEQASTAALLAASHSPHSSIDKSTSEQREAILDADGKLSSRSAATSLRHAKPQDLPSFPSSGNTANSASKAALLANGYKMDPLWQPQQSLAGSQAALRAHGKGGHVELWQAKATPDGHSAATLAMRNKGLSPKVDAGVTPDNQRGALLAATMSHNRGRQRAGSTPAPRAPAYPDAQNSTANALNAATVSHSASTRQPTDGWDSQANQAARIKNSHLDPALFGDRPPVEIEREEARHKAALQASAVSMAKLIMENQIMENQNRTSDPADIAGAQTAAIRTATPSTPDPKQEAKHYSNLQETAQRLAAERLAKVDKNFEAAQYREHYGYSDRPNRISNRLSMRSVVGVRGRRRASSEGTADLDDSDDEGQARRIRSQMSQLNSGLSKLDEKKQQYDRAKLLAAAERSVSEQMDRMNEKVYEDTGKVPPAFQVKLDELARNRAQQERELQAQNPGMTHVGGKLMDWTKIDAIAAARLKPMLDEIDSTAEKMRARDEEIKLEKEGQERRKKEEKQKQREEKDEQKRLKDEEKARKQEEKRIAREEKRKSREVKREEAKEAVATGAAAAALSEVAEKVKEDDEPAAGNAAAGDQKHKSAISRLRNSFRWSHVAERKPEHRELATSSAGSVTAITSSEAAPVPLDSQQAAHAIDVEEEGEKAETKDIADPALSEYVSTLNSAPAVEPVSAVEPSAAESIRPTESVPAADPMPTIEPISPVQSSSEDVVPTVESVEDDADDEDNEKDKWKPVVAPTAATLTAAAAAVTSPRINIEDTDTEEDESELSEKPERPPFEQKPSLSGYHNDEIPMLSAKPDLERHISQIPESDDGESSDEDWDDERAPLGQDRAQVVADRAVSASVIVDESPQTHAKSVAHTGDQPVEPPPVPAETLTQMENQRAELPKSLPSTLESPGVPKAAPVPEPLTDPVTTDPEIQLATDEGKKDHSILRQVVNPHGKKYDEQGYGTTAHAATVPDNEKVKGTSEPAKLKKRQEPAEQVVDGEKDRKGIRGLFHKLRSKDSRSENTLTGAKPSTEAKAVPPESIAAGEQSSTMTNPDDGMESTPAPAIPAVNVEVTSAERVGTDGPIGDSKHVSGLNGNPRAESPSSFTRGEASATNVDDVSSSGLDEDDISRGRAGSLVRRLGLGSRKGKGKAKARGKAEKRTSRERNQRSSGATEEEQNEEARDQFDENLAPPPAFAGQAKSESPVRETRFQEQL